MGDTSNKKPLSEDTLAITRELNGITYKLENISRHVAELKPTQNAVTLGEKRESQRFQDEQLELLRGQLRNSETSLSHVRTANIILIAINAVLAACTVLATLVDLGYIFK